MTLEELVRKSADAGLIQILGEDEPVCYIGEHWFWFAGESGVGKSAEEYMRTTNRDEVLDRIIITLMDFSADPFYFGDEFNYYVSYMKEGLKINEALQSSVQGVPQQEPRRNQGPDR